ncbi:MAG TPA: glycosyltransferase family 2 protein, partial [Acetobacteraceae bacterium]|nr:glycosyltransferase family 2 protein [Acetobacteraceae bacterium]
GARFRFFHLGTWPGGKSGALNFALRETAPDAAVIAALDCGTVVQPDWLRRMLGYFADPAIGFAWSPQADPGASPWIAATAARNNPEVVPVQAMTLVRRTALESAGGWAEGTLAGNTELGLRLLQRGWHGAHSPEGFGRAVGAQGFAAASRRRFRQAYGAMQICRIHAHALLSPFDPALTLHQRETLVAAWLPELADALCLLLLLAALAWSAGLILNPRMVSFPTLPLTLAPILLCALTVVRAVHQCPGPAGWHACTRAALAGLALSHASGGGVWQAVLGGEPDAEERQPAYAGMAQRLAPVRSELVLLVLGWSAAAGIAVARDMAQPQAVAWCVMLLVQSLPCLAAVVAALRAGPVQDANRISRVPHGAVPL